MTGALRWDLTESNPTQAGISYDARAVLEPLSTQSVLRYEPHPFGSMEARTAVARLWADRGVSVAAERVVLTASTSEAYSYLFKLLCDPGDEVLVPRPGYPLFDALAQYEAVRLVPYRLRYDGAWHIDLDSVRSRAGPRTRAILIVNPNNPTGSYARSAELAALSELGIPIVSDEVFGDYDFESGKLCRSALLADAPIVFALDGLSKLAGLPQMKLAWMTLAGTNKATTEALRRLEHIADAFLSPSVLPQIALPAWLSTQGTVRAQITARTRRNREALAALTAGTALTPLATEAGWYAVVRLPAIASEEEWTHGLLQRHGVLVQPGYFYDFEDEPYVIVSLLTPEGVFREGVDRLVRYAGEVIA